MYKYPRLSVWGYFVKENPTYSLGHSVKLIQQDVNAEPAVRLYGAFMYKYSPYRSKLVEG